MIVCYIIAMFAITAYGIICHFSNKKRAEAIEGRMAADRDWLDLTDKENVGFKYTTWGFCLCDNKYRFGNYYDAMPSERNVGYAIVSWSGEWKFDMEFFVTESGHR